MLSRRRRLISASWVILMAFLLAACDGLFGPASPSHQATTPANQPATTNTANSVGQVIASPEEPQSPSTAVAGTATAQQTPKATSPLPPTPFPYPTYRSTEGYTSISKWPSDIKRWPSNPFPASAINYINQWGRVTYLGHDLNANEYDLNIYAGGEGQGLPGSDPEQGVLVVVTSTWVTPLYLLGGPDVYRTPLKVGPVQIVWADYSRVLVVAADDTPFLFDVSSRRWLWPPGVKQPDDQAEQDYQARMKALLVSYLPPPPPKPTTVADLLRPEPTEVPPPPVVSSPIREPQGAGTLVRNCGSPTAGQRFLLHNCWGMELIDGTQIGLGAGYGRMDYGWRTETGLIVVDGCPGDYKDGAYTRFYDRQSYYVVPRYAIGLPTPTTNPNGHSPYAALQVVGADGERVHLVAQDGTEFTFDLATCHWVVPPVPTETAPPPTFTPVPPSPTELPWYAGIPPGDERDYVLKMEQLSSSVLTAVALTPVPGTPPPTPTSPPTATPNYAGAGIIAPGPWPPAQSESFRFRNYWYETQGDKRITVYAGVEGSKGSRVQGMIEVVVTSPDGKYELEAPAYYKTPTQSGYVQVVGADGEKLHLKTWNGTEFVFDLTSRQWLNP